MQQRFTAFLLRWLRVPPEPHPPHGNPASLQVFRAGRNFLNLRLLRWGLAQVAAMVGIIFWLGVFSDIGAHVEAQRVRASQPRSATNPVPAPPGPSPAPSNATPAAPAPATSPAPTQPAPGNFVERTVNSMVTEIKNQAEATEKRVKQSGKSRHRIGPVEGFHAWRDAVVNFLTHLPRPAMLLVRFVELAGAVFYVIQLPVTLFLARLDYEQRWYMVTDRSLRIRHGVWHVSESTMSFANIQQVVVSQGPLQRLLGLADVKVQSAGGGAHKEKEPGEEDMHHGLFHSVTNAPQIRDLILERLRRFRESGLGDPEEKPSTPPVAPALASAADERDLLAVARELAAEARALRTVREALAANPRGS
ncbi:MAG TPA: PH domain-containing protein [Lacunisphaera sp.]|nr:PH domain-containing protein [Lacunisphaera sp.]